MAKTVVRAKRESKESAEQKPVDQMPQYLVSEPTLYDVVNLDKVEKKEDKKGKLDHRSAEYFLSLPTFAGERPVREAHVSYLISAMQRGTFREESVEIITCDCKGKTYRMNGQHTCRAIMNMSKDFSLNVRFLNYHARNDEEMRVLYSSIDRGAARTPGNIIVSLLAGNPEFLHIPHDTLRRIAEGLAFFFWPSGHHRRLHDTNDRAQLMTNEFKTPTLQIASIMNSLSKEASKHMRRSPVIAAMYATFRVASSGERGAKAFWTAIAEGTDLKSGDPRLKLRDALMNNGIADRGASRNKKQIPTESMFRWCCVAWNAWRRQEECRHLKAHLNAPRPKLV